MIFLIPQYILKWIKYNADVLQMQQFTKFHGFKIK